MAKARNQLTDDGTARAQEAGHREVMNGSGDGRVERHGHKVEHKVVDTHEELEIQVSPAQSVTSDEATHYESLKQGR